MGNAAVSFEELPDLGERFLRLRDVRAKVALGSSTIYRRMEEGTFPRPKALGAGTVRWLQSDIDKWMKGLEATGADPSEDRRPAAGLQG